FNNRSDEPVERYLATRDSLDKAGAYGVQGPSLTFISRVEGDYANVVGFPLSRFVNEAQIFFEAHLHKKDMWLNSFYSYFFYWEFRTLKIRPLSLKAKLLN